MSLCKTNLEISAYHIVNVALSWSVARRALIMKMKPDKKVAVMLTHADTYVTYAGQPKRKWCSSSKSTELDMQTRQTLSSLLLCLLSLPNWVASSLCQHVGHGNHTWTYCSISCGDGVWKYTSSESTGKLNDWLCRQSCRVASCYGLCPKESPQPSMLFIGQRWWKYLSCHT